MADLSLVGGVLADGELTTVLEAGPIDHIYRGVLSTSGAYAIFVGGITSTSSRLFAVLIK